jgi:hypothetical protein
LLLFLEVCKENGVKFGKIKRVYVQEIALFILVKDTGKSLTSLVHEHSLVDIAGGDFAQHSGITTLL